MLYVPAPSPRPVEVGASGCPERPYTARGASGLYDIVAWSPGYTRDLVRDGAVEAVLCTSAFAAWPDPLRITRGVPELERALDHLPHSEPFRSALLPGFPETNLVLTYPDGERAVLSFDFNLGEVAADGAVRAGASALTRLFARLWRTEHAAADPADVEPPPCPVMDHLMAPFAGALVPGIVRGIWRDKGPVLPLPPAVVRACRYVPDGDRLVLRATLDVRTDLPALAAAHREGLRGAPRRCLNSSARKPPATVDVILFTDPTSRTATSTILHLPCPTPVLHYPSGSPPSPPLTTLLSRLPT
ncbi:hypothetical protein [Actinocorallia herbida]|uniref:hypothetical protein n=1 Tax=Actinocorallia herbida TaxID=58109 RepID=UPI001476FC0A|nr:hypothetical protein [Actinocorallia herbida]